MRRVIVAAVGLLVLTACSSSEDSPSEPAEGSPDAATYAADAGIVEDAMVVKDPDAQASETDAALGTEFTGQATYYNADGTGACGFKATPHDLMVTAMNHSQYKKSMCGQCVLVTGPKGTVKVRIVDLCPGCAQGGLDLSKEAFRAISPLSAGRIKIHWHFVTC